jgi:hypothetical protein
LLGDIGAAFDPNVLVGDRLGLSKDLVEIRFREDDVAALWLLCRRAVRKHERGSRADLVQSGCEFKIISAPAPDDRADAFEELVEAIIDILVRREPRHVVVCAGNHAVERHGDVKHDV